MMNKAEVISSNSRLEKKVFCFFFVFVCLFFVFTTVLQYIKVAIHISNKTRSVNFLRHKNPSVTSRCQGQGQGHKGSMSSESAYLKNYVYQINYEHSASNR